MQLHQLLQRRDEKFLLLEISVIFPSRTLWNQMSLIERAIRSAHKAIAKEFYKALKSFFYLHCR